MTAAIERAGAVWTYHHIGIEEDRKYVGRCFTEIPLIAMRS